MSGSSTERELRVSLGWLVRLRWVALLGLAAVTTLVERALHVALPRSYLLAVALMVAASNLGLQLWLSRGGRVGARLAGAVVVFDTVALTVSLYGTGGATNPLVAGYLVLVIVAAVVLGRRAAALMVVTCIGCVGGLTVVYRPLRVDHTHERHAHEATHAHDDHVHADHDHGHAHHPPAVAPPAATDDHLGLHAEGAWGVFAVLAVLVAYLVTWALRQREDELTALRAERAQADRMAELGALSASAAHELGTPLATIAVVARELERALAPGDDELAADARTIREQVDRCRAVLDELGKAAREEAGEEPLALDVVQVLLDARAVAQEPARVVLDIDESAANAQVMAPPRAIRQVLHSLLDNAHDASGPTMEVTVRARVEAGDCHIDICDQGPGMAPEQVAQAGRVPFSSKPGRGMGVGLFLGRAIVERVGGALDCASVPGEGTRITLSLPVVLPEPNR